MTISMYAASVPLLKQILQSLDAILVKAESHALEKKIEPSTLLQARLYADMYPLLKQVQIASDNAKGIAARLAGIDAPSFPDTDFMSPQRMPSCAIAASTLAKMILSASSKAHTNKLIESCTN